MCHVRLGNNIEHEIAPTPLWKHAMEHTKRTYPVMLDLVQFMANIVIGFLGRRAVDIVVLVSTVVLVPVLILSQLMEVQGVLVPVKNFGIVNIV